MSRPSLSAALLAGLACGLALADDPPPTAEPLRYRWSDLAGHTARYTVETELVQTVDHTGQPPAVGRRWRRDTVEQELRRRREGGRVRHTARRIELAISGPDSPDLRYDSDSGQEAPEGTEQALSALERTVSVDLDGRGQVLKVRGATDPLQEGAYKASSLVLPEGALQVGATWMRTPHQQVPYPPFGVLTYRTTYTLESRGEDGGWVVAATTQILFAPGPPDPKVPPATVEVVRQEGGGRMIFDPRGLLLESSFHSLLEVRIESGGVTRVERAESKTVQRLRDVSPTQH